MLFSFVHFLTLISINHVPASLNLETESVPPAVREQCRESVNKWRVGGALTEEDREGSPKWCLR